MDSTQKVYHQNARAYDAARTGSTMEEPLLREVLKHLPTRSAKILDLGCGSGEPIARFFIDQGHPLTGIDAAAAMIDICRARFPDGRWDCADMRGLDLGEQFGAVIAWDSFFHLKADDQRAMFPIFAAHTAPSGCLMFTSGPEAGEVFGSVCGHAVYHASLDPAEYERLLSENGFSVLMYRPNDPDCGGHTIWMAQRNS